MAANSNISLDSDIPCAVCGGNVFKEQSVLWPELISAWQLSSEEIDYINRQQGTICTHCGSNIRSAALAKAICSSLGYLGILDDLLKQPPSSTIFEVNEAGTLHSRLTKFPGHLFEYFPKCNLTALEHKDESFDIVVHSDTLEHVENPEKALEECWRVLVPGGHLIFTVPIIIRRLTRSRIGMSPSFHGNHSAEMPDLIVQTEYGADLWCKVLEAGFSECTFVSHGFPAGIAVIAKK